MINEAGERLKGTCAGSKWHGLIGDPTYADAILDRIVHNAQRINLTGHSLRRVRVNKTSKEGVPT
jgi:DNA replication protein DnaC